MTAYYRSDAGALADAGATFRDWQDDPELGHLAYYYLGFAAYQRALWLRGEAGIAPGGGGLLLAAITRDDLSRYALSRI